MLLRIAQYCLRFASETIGIVSGAKVVVEDWGLVLLLELDLCQSCCLLWFVSRECSHAFYQFDWLGQRKGSGMECSGSDDSS